MTYQTASIELGEPLERAADVVCVEGMLQRAAVCLSLYKNGYKERAKHWCNDDLINFLKVPDENAKGQVRSINSLAQLYNIFRGKSGELNESLLAEYQSLFKELLPLLLKIRKDDDIAVEDEMLKRLEEASARLGHLYASVCDHLY